MSKWWRASHCSVTPGDRIFRALASVVLAAFALSAFSTNLACAIPAAVCATFLMIGAITGWCPTQIFSSPPSQQPNALGYPEAKQKIEL